MHKLTNSQKLENLEEQEILLTEKMLRIQKQIDGIRMKKCKLSSNENPSTVTGKLNNFSR